MLCPVVSFPFPLLVPGTLALLRIEILFIKVPLPFIWAVLLDGDSFRMARGQLHLPHGETEPVGKVHMVCSLSHSNFSSLCLIPFLIPLPPSTSRDVNRALYSKLRLGLRRSEQATLIISLSVSLFLAGYGDSVCWQNELHSLSMSFASGLSSHLTLVCLLSAFDTSGKIEFNVQLYLNI